VAAEIPLARLVAPPAASAELDPLLARVLESIKLADPFDLKTMSGCCAGCGDATIVTLSTEGYFSAKVTAEKDTDGKARYVLRIDPGPRAKVVAAEIRLRGGIEEQPRGAGTSGRVGIAGRSPFRDAIWSSSRPACWRGSESTTSPLPGCRFAGRGGRRIGNSQADGGNRQRPRLYRGELSIKGLERFDPVCRALQPVCIR